MFEFPHLKQVFIVKSQKRIVLVENQNQSKQLLIDPRQIFYFLKLQITFDQRGFNILETKSDLKVRFQVSSLD